MTLLRIGLGFLAVAVFFVGFAWVTGGRKRGTVAVPALEALVLTLFTALWFGSLGHGSWVLVFFLLGLLASGFGSRTEAGPGVLWSRATLITAARYVAAGGILALLLG